MNKEQLGLNQQHFPNQQAWDFTNVSFTSKHELQTCRNAWGFHPEKTKRDSGFDFPSQNPTVSTAQMLQLKQAGGLAILAHSNMLCLKCAMGLSYGNNRK